MKKVAVLAGGGTPEYEISLLSGMEVCRNMDRSKFEPMPVVISRNNREWYTVPPDAFLELANPLLETRNFEKQLRSVRESVDPFSFLVSVDVAFIAMHGPYGEDGTLQGFLDFLKVAYTGPGVIPSSIGMDKAYFRKIIKNEGYAIPRYVESYTEVDYKEVSKRLNCSVYIVKPNKAGSSVGMSKATDQETLDEAVREAQKYDKHVLIDEYIEGIEVTCAVIGNEDAEALPLVEIVPHKGEFFNYESKYFEGGADEIVPARISEKLTKKVQQSALELYKFLGCKGFSRVDYIVSKDNTPYLLEINTIPGLTPQSLLPRAAMATGISYSELVTKIIEYGIS